MVIVCGRRPMTARTGLPASRPAAILSQAGVRASRASAPTASDVASTAADPINLNPNTGLIRKAQILVAAVSGDPSIATLTTQIGRPRVDHRRRDAKMTE